MTTLKRVFSIVLVSAGIMASVIGITLVFFPSYAESVGLSDSMIIISGLLALFFGLQEGMIRQRSDRELAEVPEPERAQTMPAPGDDFEDTLSDLGVAGRQDLKDRLENTLTTVIMKKRECSEVEAREIIQNGEWTNDERAAKFLKEDATVKPAIWEQGKKMVDEVLNRVQGEQKAESEFHELARHTADEIARVSVVTKREEDLQ